MNWIEMHKQFARENEGATFTKETAVQAFRQRFDPNGNSGLKFESNVGFNWYCGGSADNARRPVLAAVTGRGLYRILPESEWMAASGSKTRTASAPAPAPADPFAGNEEIAILRRKIEQQKQQAVIDAEIARLKALLTPEQVASAKEELEDRDN